jgi:hypothetical protein
MWGVKLKAQNAINKADLAAMFTVFLRIVIDEAGRSSGGA